MALARPPRRPAVPALARRTPPRQLPAQAPRRPGGRERRLQGGGRDEGGGERARGGAPAPQAGDGPARRGVRAPTAGWDRRRRRCTSRRRGSPSAATARSSTGTTSDDIPSDSDLFRIVLYTGYRFTPKILFNAEIEYEHQDEVAVEFAYLDFLLTEEVGIRVGNVLVPMGFVNELHEPPFFHGVFRPTVERNLIPATWNENGLGLHGAIGPLRYKAYGLVGLNGASGDLSSGTWLRGARTGGGEAPAETFAGVAERSATRPGPLSVGGRGLSRARRAGRGGRPGRDSGADVTLAEAHAQLVWRGLQLRGLLRHGLARRRGAALGAAGRRGRARIAHARRLPRGGVRRARARARRTAASRSRRSSATRCSTCTTRCRPASRVTRPSIRRSGRPGSPTSPSRRWS